MDVAQPITLVRRQEQDGPERQDMKGQGYAQSYVHVPTYSVPSSSVGPPPSATRPILRKPAAFSAPITCMTDA